MIVDLDEAINIWKSLTCLENRRFHDIILPQFEKSKSLYEFKIHDRPFQGYFGLNHDSEKSEDDSICNMCGREECYDECSQF